MGLSYEMMAGYLSWGSSAGGLKLRLTEVGAVVVSGRAVSPALKCFYHIRGRVRKQAARDPLQFCLVNWGHLHL